MAVPVPVPDPNLTQMDKDLHKAVRDVSQLTTDLTTIETNVKDSIHQILNTFQSESEFRRNMVQSFKVLSDLLKKCQEDKGLSPELKNQIKEQTDQSSNLTSQDKDKDLANQVARLEYELGVAKEKISTLQMQVNNAVQTRSRLTSENQQLNLVNQDYKTEIEQQLTLVQRINNYIATFKDKISKFMTTSSNVKQNVMLYLPDTILSEIRHDVIRGHPFDYINTEPNNETLKERVLRDINAKWIQQLQSLVTDLSGIIDNLTKYGNTDTQEAVGMWKNYREKLTEFLNVWSQKGPALVQSWIDKRKK
jgi:chromosome segregation ATPase